MAFQDFFYLSVTAGTSRVHYHIVAVYDLVSPVLPSYLSVWGAVIARCMERPRSKYTGPVPVSNVKNVKRRARRMKQSGMMEKRNVTCVGGTWMSVRSLGRWCIKVGKAIGEINSKNI